MRTRGSTTKRLITFISSIMMFVLVASSVFAAPPNTEFLPTFAVETLTPVSQAAAAWKNVAPNALASYYTYQPLTNADALLAGFPATCGDKASALPADQASTLDCYIITVKKLIQPMSLDFLNLTGISAAAGANLFPGPGLLQADGLTPFVNQTTTVTNLLASAGGMTSAWGYGSGGNNWQPFGAAGPTLARGNAPAVFANTPIGLTTGEGAGVTGIWHFPAPTIKGKGTHDYLNPQLDPPRPVLVLWQNDLPNEKPVGHDPTVDCGEVAEFCYPYDRIVTHVHGAHVGPESDGLAVAWYNKNFKLFGEGKFTGTAPLDGYLYTLGAGSTGQVPVALQGAPLYYYPMTQEAGTIWYHDHAIGTTHLNTNMGMAGFFPLTDSIEIALQTPTPAIPADPLAVPPVAGSPAVPAVLPTGDFELGFALQDRHFGVDGEMVFPASAVYDKNDINCVMDADNNALPGTCARLHWMKQLGNPLLTAG
ncbi:MAG: multicopper oxidase domain-containing protein [Geobacteraceae bacterium]|nr:multicopper oxidase domain-containing protein [Geobacteraceae bacterium]